MRLIIGTEIPMNQECLAPIEVILPKGSFLNPSSGPAVCSGNTLTSQRLVDVSLKAFHTAVALHGCMKCLEFFGEGGLDKDGKKLSGFVSAFGETICGGSGATPDTHGASGVHTHMTNTRITNPRQFAVREGTGGHGRRNGDNGVTRDIECRAPLSFSVITEQRSFAPFGMEGGGDGVPTIG